MGLSFLPARGRAKPLRRARGTRKGSLGAILQNFKSVTTRSGNHLLGTVGARLRQRNDYDRAIRDEGELSRIRRYIQDNPVRWDLDQYHPSQPYA